MTNPTSSQIASLSRDAAHRLTDRIIDESEGAGFSANSVLASHPELRNYPSCVVDLAYEEFCRGRETGNTIAASKFVEAFSTVQQSLYRVIEFDQILRDHPSLVEEVPEERWPKAGERFLGFELAEQLGRGALSRVFLARHSKLGQKQVVVKVCIRGEREADLLGKLEHPCIGEVHSIDIDEPTGLAAICMPFQTRFTMHHVAEWMFNSEDGKVSQTFNAGVIAQHVHKLSSLADDVNSSAGPLATPFFDDDNLEQIIVKWGVQLAEAIGNAHANGVLHCDVKPGNVLILPDVSTRLLDFNLATSDVDTARLAGGTLPYMAPEQLNFIQASDADLRETEDYDSADQLMDQSTDVFGLCATIWHMATGSPPFGSIADNATRRESVKEMLSRIEAGISDSAIAHAADVLPVETIRVLVKGMSFYRDDRQASMAILATDFGSRIKKRPRTKKILAVVAAVSLSLSAAAMSAYIADPVPAAEARARELLREGNPEGAQKILANLKFANDTTRILELAARTSMIESLDYSMLQSQQTSDDVYVEWDQLFAEWLNLAETTGHPELCLFNAYLVRLEMTIEPDEGFEIFQQYAAKVDESEINGRRQQFIKALTLSNEKVFGNATAIDQLISTVEEGTRGEFIALYRIVLREWINQPTEEMDRNLDRMLLHLDSEQAVGEPRLVKFWFGKQRKQRKEESSVKRIAVRLYHSPNSRTFNNLGKHLKLPPE